MRTTVTLDADTEQILRQWMAERGVSFKEALNEAVRAGAPARTKSPFRTRSRPMGVPIVNLDRALQLAGELEDEELVRKLRSGQ